MKKQRFILLEDCQLLCNGLHEWLNEEPGFQVLLQTGNWNEFKTKAEVHYRTNIITTFHWILKYPGLQEFNEFFRQRPLMNVVCLDDGAPTFSSISLVDSSIGGVINLTSDKDEFLWGVKNIVEGRFYVSRRMSTFGPGPHETLGKHNGCANIVLTKREEEILKYISLGFSDMEIGEALFLGTRTVSNCRANLMMKLGAESSENLVKFAAERNLCMG